MHLCMWPQGQPQRRASRALAADLEVATVDAVMGNVSSSAAAAGSSDRPAAQRVAVQALAGVAPSVAGPSIQVSSIFKLTGHACSMQAPSV